MFSFGNSWLHHSYDLENDTEIIFGVLSKIILFSSHWQIKTDISSRKMAQYSDKRYICQTFEMHYHMFSFFLRSQNIIIEKFYAKSAIDFLFMAGFLRFSLVFNVFAFESGHALKVSI